MIFVWLDCVFPHYDLVVSHVLGLELVGTIIILEVSSEMAHFVDPGYDLLPTYLPHNLKMGVREIRKSVV